MASHDYILTSTTTGTGLYDMNISNILSNLQTGDKLSIKAYATNYVGTSVSTTITMIK